MKSAHANTEAVSRMSDGSKLFRLSRLAAALAASSLFGAGSAQAFISDIGHEPTNNLITGATLGAVGDEFRGCIGDSCFDGTTSVNDPEDFVKFGSLTSGATYTLSLAEICGGSCGNSVAFDLYDNGLTTIAQTETLGPGATLPVPGLTGLTSLVVGVHIGVGSGCCEGYSVKLQSASTTVPEPASLALVSVGIVGAFVARRRKRT